MAHSTFVKMIKSCQKFEYLTKSCHEMKENYHKMIKKYHNIR